MARQVWEDVEYWSMSRMGTMALWRTMFSGSKFALAMLISLKVFGFV